nr:unnamed protein product [Callosobruchus analis]
MTVEKVVELVCLYRFSLKLPRSSILTLRSCHLLSDMAQTSRPKLSDEQLREIIVSDDFWNDIETSDNEEIDAVVNDQLDTLQQIMDAGDQSDADEEDDEIFSKHDSDSDLEWHPTDDEGEVQLDETDSNAKKLLVWKGKYQVGLKRNFGTYCTAYKYQN